MGSLSQYLEFYKANRESINAHSSTMLNGYREEAFRRLAGGRLPGLGDESYEKSSIDEMFGYDYGINALRIDFSAVRDSSFRCDVPNLSKLMALVVNDSYIPQALERAPLPEGVIIDSISNAANLYPQIVKKYYGTIAPADNAGVGLNTMLVQDGFFFYVPKGVKMEKPVQLVNLFNAPAPMMGVRRLLIIIEDGAGAQLLICDHSQNSEHKYLSSQVVEVHLGAAARLDICDMEESSPQTSRYSQMFVRQNSDSDLLVNGVTLSGGSTRNNYQIDVVGENCQTLVAGLAIGALSQHIDNCSNVNHKGAHCHSLQLFKYLLDDNSSGAFEGSIYVDPQAPFTEAYQSNRNILASAQARMHTKPQLEIYNDDVKCSHGTTTGQLDAKSLFYMRSRGIPEKTARTLLMQAFMNDVVNTIRIDGMRQRLRHLVERRLYGQAAFCAKCKSKSPK